MTRQLVAEKNKCQKMTIPPITDEHVSWRTASLSHRTRIIACQSEQYQRGVDLRRNLVLHQAAGSAPGWGGASANDELRWHGDGPFDLFASQQAQDHPGGEHALLINGLAYRAQVGQLGQGMVIDADDRDVFRYPEPRAADGSDSSESDFVGVGEDGGRRRTQAE